MANSLPARLHVAILWSSSGEVRVLDRRNARELVVLIEPDRDEPPSRVAERHLVFMATEVKNKPPTTSGRLDFEMPRCAHMVERDVVAKAVMLGCYVTGRALPMFFKKLY